LEVLVGEKHEMLRSFLTKKMRYGVEEYLK
jgi:hypothetical protein